jgi:hypothetical protein
MINRLEQRKERIGQKFGKIETVSTIKKGHYYQYLCKCDCGKKSILPWRDIHAKKGDDCFGCNRGKSLKGGSAILTLFKRYNNKAKIRGIEFKLSFEEFNHLVFQNCFYCGLQPSLITKNWSDYNPEQIKHNGIDRVYNELPYILDNCVPCCEWCNRAKHEREPEDFLKWIMFLKNEFQTK